MTENCTQKIGEKWVDGKREDVIHWNSQHECDVQRYRWYGGFQQFDSQIWSIVKQLKDHGKYVPCGDVHDDACQIVCCDTHSFIEPDIHGEDYACLSSQ